MRIFVRGDYLRSGGCLHGKGIECVIQANEISCDYLPSRHPNPAHTQPQLAIKRTHRINTKKKKLSKYLDKRTDYANEGLVRSISEHRQRACVFPLGNFLFRQSNRSRVHNSQFIRWPQYC